MTEQELIEQLADKEHASWARWMAYLFSKCERMRGEGGQMVVAIPDSLAAHWQRQIETPYADLTEREQQYDRDEVTHILPIIRKYVRDRKALSVAFDETYDRDPTFQQLLEDATVEAQLGLALADARRRRHLTQRDLARMTDIPQPGISRLEKAGVTPTIATVACVLCALNARLVLTPQGVSVDLLDEGGTA